MVVSPLPFLIMARNSLGAGYCSAYDPVSDSNILIAMLSVSATEETETETSQGHPYLARGVLVDYDELLTARSMELEIEFEQITANQIPLILNRRGASQNFAHPVAKAISLAATTVEVTGLTADQPVQIVELLSIAPGQRQFTQIASTQPAPDPEDPPVPNDPPDPGEYMVTANTITFNAADVGPGKTAGLRYYSSSTKLVYGGPNAISSFDSLEIYVEQELTKVAPMAFYFPKVQLTSGAQIAIQAGGDAVTLTGKALIDTERGFNDYFASWEI